MLQTMRDNAQGIVAKFIVFFIIFVFALWGVESIVNLGSGSEPLAQVGGQEITEVEVQRAVEQQKATLRRQFGEQFDESLFNDGVLRQSAIEQLIQRKVQLVKAHEMGLYASPAQIDEAIVTIPAFQLDGNFNKEQFRSILAMNGWTPLTFRENLSQDIIVNQLNAAVVQTTIAAPYQVRLNAMLDGEMRTVSWVQLNARDLTNGITLSDDEVQASYEATKNLYQTPETVSIRYVGFNRKDVAAKMEVTEDELKQAYNDYLTQLKDKEQRNASHILIEVNDKRDDAAAQALAADIEKRIAGGEDFAKLATEFSDDIGTRNQGGELGFAARGAYVEAFDNVLFGMEEGTVSEPVKTEFGYHIIKLMGVKAADAASLDDKREELSAWIRDEKAQQHIAEQTQELTNIAFSASGVNDIADALGLKAEVSAPFTRDAGEGIAADAKVREEAFADNVLLDHETSQVVETDSGVYVFAVEEHKEAEVQPLAEVRNRVETRLKREKALELAHQRADAIVKGSGDAPEWKSVSVNFRQSSDLPREAQARAFAMAKGAVEAVDVNGGVAVVRVDAVQVPEMADLTASDDGKMSQLSRISRQGMISFRKWAEANTEIKRPGA
ncbi:SurA N-terminal domain-containing protein [Parathalassolituus penaei]|uniref:Periplasmic chaperone PpiD n=1 Tax=Parathalassolituus penaei TaxID=2997323 RepID=A0A9X3EF31_9GAMM|nr:SurA N-terminal domain-containing protein [Parathalassolituus penaei]MCY0966407.1 SurA N-terminal domain-containing protein [Parathalassolituus penaei]